MNRRNFLKALGLGSGASAISACGLDDNRYYTPIEQVLPYVVRPEQVTPGTPTYFATSVGTGPSAYPVLALHREGRITNVVANRQTDAQPAVSTTDLFDLQRHYSPDRIRQPMVDGAPASWDDGLAKLADAVKGARASGKKVVYLGGYRTGSIAALLSSFTGGNAIHWEPLGRSAEAKAAEALFGSADLPRYDIEPAHYLLSFGAEFLGGGWGGAWSQSAYAAARNPENNHAVCRFALVSPIRGQAGANCDDWFAATPGSEAQVALAVAKLVAAKTHYTGPALALVNAADPAAAAQASGLTEDDLNGMADLFAAHPAIALPGGVSGANGNATELAAAVMLLNVVSKHGLMTGGGYTGAVHGHDAVQGLVKDLEAGNVGVLLVDDADPVYALPGDGFAAAMAKAGLAVSVSSHPSETQAKCALTLPTSDSFEDWGDEEPHQGFRILRQPSQTPLWDTRSLGDILLATWRAADAENAPTGDWRSYIEGRWAAAYMAAQAPATDEGEDAPEAAAATDEGEEAEVVVDSGFATFWDETLQAGAATAGFAAAAAALDVTGTFTFGAAATAAGSGAYFLHAFSHPFLRDGRYANQPWAQETPEPLTGQVWDTWVLLHPETAAALGVEDNDAVTLTSDNGSIELGVEIQPFVRKDVVAVAFGNGHTAASGRYAEDTGTNVVALLGDTTDAHGELAWQQVKVAVAASGGKADLVSTFGGDHDSDRNWAVKVPAEMYAEKGDAPQAHGGEFTGIHHLPMDRRLQKAGITDFYMDPDHPTYRFAMSIDTDACTGCGACAVACYAENNLPVVGKTKTGEGREMGWVRVNRYVKGDDIFFVPMMCQQCGHAPCESVCPVLATYHTIDGLNAMVYNRCAGTRYCSNACPYSVRKFNYHSYVWPEPFNLQLNPDVVTRTMGVMEKCTFCVQRIRRIKSSYKDHHGLTSVVPAEALTQLTACADACPSQAITFGNAEDPESPVTLSRKSGRNYIPLAELNTFPAINYLGKASFHHTLDAHHGGGHGDDHGGDHGDAHGDEHAPADDHHEAPAHDADGH